MAKRGRKPGDKPVKASNACHVDKRMRLEEITKLMLSGKSTMTISNLIKEKYDIGHATTRRDIAACLKEISKTLDLKKEQHFTKAIMMKEQIIEKLIEGGNFAMASQSLDSLHKMQGLFKENDEATINIEVFQD